MRLPARSLLLAFLSCCLFALPLRAADEALSLDERLKFANGLYARGMWDMALKEYESLLGEHATFESRPISLYRAGECARRLARPKTARIWYLQAAETKAGEARSRSLLRLIENDLKLKDTQSAYGHAEQLTKEKDLDPSIAAAAVYYLGKTAQDLGKTDEAAAAYTKLMEKYPTNVFAQYGALKHAALAGMSAKAKRDLFHFVLKAKPSENVALEAHWGLAKLTADEGQTERAAEQMLRLKQRYPKQARIQQGLFTIAWTCLQAGRNEEALALSKEVTPATRKGNEAPWLYIQASSLRNLRQTDAAAEAYAALLEAWPDQPLTGVAVYEWAVLEFARKNYDKVLSLSESLLKQEDTRDDGLWLLAEAARAKGQEKQALAWYDQWLTDYPKGSRRADVSYNRAVVLQDIDPAKAAAAFEAFGTAYAKDERAGSALYAAGLWQLSDGNEKKAKSLWESMLRIEPEHEEAATVSFQNALMDLRGGDQEKGIAGLEAFLERTPLPAQAPEAAYWLAVELQKAGETNPAIKRFKQALDGKLPAERVGDARLRLGVLHQQADRPGEALNAFLPLIKGTEAPLLSDALLGWMLAVAREQKDGLSTEIVATAMTGDKRDGLTRELGYYARGKVLMPDAKKKKEAIAAFVAGLELVEKESAESAEAALLLGDLLRQSADIRGASERYNQAKLAAEKAGRDDLEARAVYGQALTLAAAGDWAETSRIAMMFAVLYDDASLSPQALHLAARAFDKQGLSEQAEQARAECKKRYPDFKAE